MVEYMILARYHYMGTHQKKNTNASVQLDSSTREPWNEEP